MFLGRVGFSFEGNSDENDSKLVIFVMPETPTPRRRGPRLGGGSFA